MYEHLKKIKITVPDPVLPARGFVQVSSVQASDIKHNVERLEI